MAREVISDWGDRVTDIVVIELHDSPPFHAQVVGKLRLDGKEKFFSYTFNKNTVPTVAPRIHEAVLRFTEGRQ